MTNGAINEGQNVTETKNETKGWNKPRPNIDADNAAFWDGLTRHELLLWTCDKCGTAYWPKSYCINHENDEFAQKMSWKPSSGMGRIFAMNRHEYAFHPGFREAVPYFYALVELDEGPLISSTIVGEQPTDPIADTGRRVRIAYEDYPEEGFTIPRFELVDE
ncbi:Zn-ribbon domain-containing OB-fold protein [Streptomyces sp. NPDC059909]|uniref:Zn-ribbon domain-containing OB-fold protein n=1 Tax=Streptomyces sp. NPDC059909 TaxID=3346998 RepID=UPI00365FD787